MEEAQAGVQCGSKGTSLRSRVLAAVLLEGQGSNCRGTVTDTNGLPVFPAAFLRPNFELHKQRCLKRRPAD